MEPEGAPPSVSDACGCEAELSVLRLGVCRTFFAAGILPDLLLGCDEFVVTEEPIPPPTGSGCHPKISYVNESGVFPVTCLDKLTEYKCDILQGTWNGEESCAESDCEPFGACCDATGGCAIGTENACKGTWHEAKNCEAITCAEPTPKLDPTGACCSQSGEKWVCAERSERDCVKLKGTYAAGKACSSVACPALKLPPIILR